MFYIKNKNNYALQSFKNQRSCPNGTRPYTIMAGDTLYSIATKFGTNVLQILFFNPFLQPYNLRVGQMICVPSDACPDGTFYTIQPGDTLYTISRNQGVSIDAILDANPLLDPYNLMPGRLICIPPQQAPRECPENTTRYVVKSGDSLTKLLVKYDYSYTAMLHYNPDVDFSNLTPGTQLCIPDEDTFSIGYCPTGKTYVTQENDTVISIAEKYVVTTDDLMIVNPYYKPSDFENPSITICIPESTEV